MLYRLAKIPATKYAKMATRIVGPTIENRLSSICMRYFVKQWIREVELS